MRPAALAGGLYLQIAVAAIVPGATGLLLAHAVLLALVLAVALAPQGARQAWALPRRPWIPLAIFALLVLTGSAFAPYAYAAWLTLLELAAFGAMLWLAARCGPGLLRRLSWPFASLVGGIAVVVLLNRLTGGPQSILGFVNPNHLAGWLVVLSLAIAPVMVGRLVVGGPRSWILASLLAAPVPWAVAATGSRGAFVGLCVGLITLTCLHLRRLSPTARRAVVAAVAVVLVVVGAGVIDRFLRPDAFGYQRTSIWAASLRMIAERPWLGTGPRQFAEASGEFQFDDGYGPLRYDRGFSRTHSDLLRLPAEFGIPASIALVAALLLAFRREDGDRPSAADPARAGPIAALTALVTHCALENLSEAAAVYFLAALLLGSLLSIPRLARQTPPLGLRIGLALLLTLIFVVGDLSPYMAWRAVDGLPRGRLDEAGAQRLERAIRLNRLQADYRRRVAEHVSGAGDDWSPESYARAREAAEHAVRLDPAGSIYRIGLGRVEALACRTLFAEDLATVKRAAAAYNRAAALDRHNGLIRLEQAAALLDCGAADLAIAAAEQALEIEPEAVAPRLVLAGALLRRGEADAERRARELLARAEELAEEHRDWLGQSPYAARMLTLDRYQVERIAQALPSDDVARVP